MSKKTFVHKKKKSTLIKLLINFYFVSFTVLTFQKVDLLLLYTLHLLHDNGVNPKKYKILEREILSPSGSLLSCRGLKPEWAFPKLPAVLFVWTATGHKSGRRCPPCHLSNADRGSGLRWNAFERRKKHHFRLKSNVKIKMGEKP